MNIPYAPYDFNIQPAQLEPVIMEPIIQAAMKVISHGTLVVMFLKELVALFKELNVSSLIMRVLNAYYLNINTE